MKKLFFLACVMMSAMLTFAQETKKVAILEVVDRQGNVSYANKLILRSSLAKAITNTPGYEAYDRTDMDAILGEQNFQRTGMVSNDQIKRVGEMTGAKYVLVAEAAVVDDNTMYITAKLLDVETARTEMTDNQMMGTTAKEIQRGSQELAANLVKPVVASYSRQQVAKSGKTVKHEENSISKGVITKISNNEYRIGETKMDRKAYENFLYENCPQAWKKHLQAKRTIAAGWSFFSIGIALTSMWGLLGVQDEYVQYRDSYGNYHGYYKTSGELEVTAISLGSIGAGSAFLGSLLLAGGYGAKAKAYKIYNKTCAYSTPITFNLTTGQNGLGIAMNF